jgi:ATP-binding cassette, subfamily B, bacterial PglK
MLSTIRRSWKLLTRRQKIGLSILSFFRMSVNMLDAIGITLIGIAITVFLGNINSVQALDWFPSPLRESPSLILMVIALIFVSKTVLGILLARRTGLFLARVETHHSQRIAQTLFSEGLAKTKQLSRADMEWTVLRSTDFAFQKVLNQSMSLLAEASLAVFIFGLMVIADWQASLAITAYFLVVLGIFQWFSSSKYLVAGARLSAGSVLVTTVITDLVNTFREISVMQKTNHYLDVFAKARRQVADSNAIHYYLQSIPRLLVETSLIVGALVFLSWEFFRTSGEVDFSALGILLVGSLRIMSALLPLQRSFSELRYVEAQAGAAQTLLEGSLSQEKPQPTPMIESARVSSSDAPQGGLRVEISKVTFAFVDQPDPKDSPTGGSTTPVIDGISLAIQPGGYVALVGPSGAGKSTLVDLILGLYQPSSGDILVEGLPAREFFARHPGIVGYVPQKPGIVSGTIAQNIALGVESSEVDDDAVWAAIRTAQLEEYVTGLPAGIHSDLGPHADSLSGGQKQRLGLARALYTNPKFLVLDEATSALDAQTESSVTESLMALRGEVTVLVVAHRLSTVQNVDTAYVLDKGKIIASGPFSKLRRDVPLIKNYIELMSFDTEEDE